MGARVIGPMRCARGCSWKSGRRDDPPRARRAPGAGRLRAGLPRHRRRRCRPSRASTSNATPGAGTRWRAFRSRSSAAARRRPPTTACGRTGRSASSTPAGAAPPTGRLRRSRARPRWSGRGRCGAAGPHPFPGDYWVLWVADDYSHRGGRHAGGRAGWVLHRSPEIPAEQLATAREVLAANGYDVTQLQRTGTDAQGSNHRRRRDRRRLGRAVPAQRLGCRGFRPRPEAPRKVAEVLANARASLPALSDVPMPAEGRLTSHQHQEAPCKALITFRNPSLSGWT
jgi:hypothetical protein